MIPSLLFFPHSAISSPGAPAATLHHFAGEARKEVCPGLAQATCRKNAPRDAHAFVAKWGLASKVPMSYVDHMVDGAPVPVPFLSPKAWVKFLLEKAPELVLGGCQNKDDGRAYLKSFWKAYAKEHPLHRLFGENHDSRLWKTPFVWVFVVMKVVGWKVQHGSADDRNQHWFGNWRQHGTETKSLRLLWMHHQHWYSQEVLPSSGHHRVPATIKSMFLPNHQHEKT